MRMSMLSQPFLSYGNSDVTRDHRGAAGKGEARNAQPLARCGRSGPAGFYSVAPW